MKNKWMIGFLVLAGTAIFAINDNGRKFFTALIVSDLPNEVTSTPSVADNFETTNKILEQIEGGVDLCTGEKFFFNWVETPVKQFDKPENLANRHPYRNFKCEEKVERDGEDFSTCWTWSLE